MEPFPASTEDPHPAAPEPVPIAAARVLHDHGQHDRMRDWRGKPCRKSLKVLDNPHKVAFKGWTDVQSHERSSNASNISNGAMLGRRSNKTGILLTAKRIKQI